MKNFNTEHIISKFFLVIVFIILILPVMHINSEEIATEENRSLAKYVPIYNYRDKVFNFEYGNNFETYLKDRFWGRIKIIKVDRYLKYFLSGRFVKFNSFVIDKKEKFTHAILISGTYNKYTQNKMYEQLKLFNAYCQRHNIKLYIVIIPQKEMIYKPQLARIDNNEKIKTILSKINRDNSLNLIFPIDEFLEIKKTSLYPLFYKTDSHTSYDGAFIGYNELMKVVKKDFPNIKVMQPEDFDCFFDKRVFMLTDKKLGRGNACQYTGIPDSICYSLQNTENRFYVHKDKKNLNIKDLNSDDILKEIYFYPKGSNLKLMIFGDSSMENLMHILPYSFKMTNKIRLNGPRNLKDDEERFKILKYYEKEIDEFKPDIIVIHVSYTLSKRLRNIAVTN